MPTYTFRCSGCDWTADKRVSFRAAGEQRCPACGSVAERLSVYAINATGFAAPGKHDADLSRPFREYQEASAEIKPDEHKAALHEARRRAGVR